MRHILGLAVLLSAAAYIHAQVPISVGVQILKAEDARRYDSVLENLMSSPNADIRARAALAAGRIGDNSSLPVLARLLENDADIRVRSMAAFAIGETESIHGAEAVLAGLKREGATKSLADTANPYARLVEAAGKIAAANSKDLKAKQLGAAILDVLRAGPSDVLAVRLAHSRT